MAKAESKNAAQHVYRCMGHPSTRKNTAHTHTWSSILQLITDTDTFLVTRLVTYMSVESVEASSRTATTNGHLGQQWGGLGSPALVIGSRPRPPFSSNSTVIGHPAGMGNSLPHKLPSASSSQLQAVTEDDFPTGWHEIDASFESYVGFAVTKNLAKFPKEARKAVRKPCHPERCHGMTTA